MPYTFTRGVHPPDSKKQTADLAVREIAVPETLVVPLAQHIGAPASAVVAKGDKVDKGSVIGEAGGFVSAAVHAPVSGEVVAIEMRVLALARPGECVIIKNDFEERWAEGANVEVDPESLDAGAIKERVRAAGIVGMGGATFPTSVKLSPPEGKTIETLVLNGAECEPYLTADHRLMLEEPGKILHGAILAARAVGAESIVVAVEDNKLDAIDALKRAASGIDAVKVEALATRYPQGAEKQLIESVTGRQVPSGGLPMDVGILVQNVATCAAMYDAVAFGRPLVERVLTATGPCAASPGNFLVRVGTPYADVLGEVGFSSPPKRVISGGPMMGIAQTSLDTPVTKGTSGLLLLDEVPDYTWKACIRCGRCVRACPVSIMPAELSVLIEGGRVDDALALDLLDCIECGCCAYVCPSNRPIVNLVKSAKAEVQARRAKERKAGK